MSQYELIILGSPPPDVIAALRKGLAAVAADFGLAMPGDLAIRRAQDANARSPSASTAALHFGGTQNEDPALVRELQDARIPIVPVVPIGTSVTDAIPSSIQATNALFIDPDDREQNPLVAVALECLGLLRRQRRVFISYRRLDSRDAAVQLHDKLSGRGFDVFLDTHDILPGDPFQEMLWHRLADCDVVIMLDTKDYFSSKWTVQELGRSLAKGISILRVIWPGHQPTRHLTLSDAIQLEPADLGSDGRLDPSRVDEIVRRTEGLRSRSVASRHREIAGTLRIEVERLGGTYEGIGAHRAIAFSLPNGLAIQAYPVVGVPTAELLNDIHDKARATGHSRFPCLVYDHNGIRPAWLAHLEWLDAKITDVRALKVFNAAWELAKWDI